MFLKSFFLILLPVALTTASRFGTEYKRLIWL